MSDEPETKVMGKVTNVAVTVGDLTGQMMLPVSRSVLFSLIIGRPAIKQMKSILTFNEDISVSRGDGKTVDWQSWTDRESNNDALSKNYTSSDEEYRASATKLERSSNNNYADECGPVSEGFTICFNGAEENKSKISKEELLQEAAGHVSKENGISMKNALIEKKHITAWILDEFRSVNVTYSNAFKLTNYKFICPPLVQY